MRGSGSQSPREPERKLLRAAAGGLWATHAAARLAASIRAAWRHAIVGVRAPSRLGEPGAWPLLTRREAGTMPALLLCLRMLECIQHSPRAHRSHTTRQEDGQLWRALYVLAHCLVTCPSISMSVCPSAYLSICLYYSPPPRITTTVGHKIAHATQARIHPRIPRYAIRPHDTRIGLRGLGALA